VRQNVAHLERDIPADLWAERRQEALLHPAAPVPGGARP